MVTVLVTPQFASILELDNPNFINLIKAQCHSARPDDQINVLAAVVDEVPSPSSRRRGELGASAPSTDPRTGISVLVRDSEALLLRLWEDDGGLSTHGANALDGTLGFSIDVQEVSGNGHTQSSASSQHQLTLALPNTIFESGREHTLIALCYSVTDVSTEGQVTDLRCIRSRHLHRFNLDLGSAKSPLAARATIDNAAMQPLTSFRKITDAMGNIVRRLAAPGPDATPLPASRELEEALRAEKSLNFEIWAEVAPGGEPADPSQQLQEALQRGHRFYRITGGGGGWGARAGLLSLEPPRLLAPPVAAEEDRAPGLAGAELLVTELAKPGDLVRFWRVPVFRHADYTQGTAHEDHTQGIAREETGEQDVESTAVTFVFGSSPFKEPKDITQPESLGASTPVVYGLFGALSHQPAALTIGAYSRPNGSIADHVVKPLSRSVLPPSSRVSFASE